MYGVEKQADVKYEQTLEHPVDLTRFQINKGRLRNSWPGYMAGVKRGDGEGRWGQGVGVDGQDKDLLQFRSHDTRQCVECPGLERSLKTYLSAVREKQLLAKTSPTQTEPFLRRPGVRFFFTQFLEIFLNVSSIMVYQIVLPFTVSFKLPYVL